MGSGSEALRWKNGFRAFHRAKMSTQDTQVNTVSCTFFQKPKHIKYLKTLYLRRVARTFIFVVQVGQYVLCLYEVVRPKAQVRATSYSFPEIYQSNTTQIL